MNVKSTIKKQLQLLQSKKSSKFSLYVEGNQEFRKCHSGKRCFILGTGPSINKQNLTFLKNEICFSVSEFYLHPELSTINPQYHVIAPNHTPFDQTHVEHRVHQINKFFTSDTHIFIGDNNYKHRYWNYLLNQNLLESGNISLLNYEYPYQLDEKNYQKESTWDIARRPFSPRTVIYIALQLAFYMDFDEVHLLGVDHDYLDDVKRVSNHHFYLEHEGISDAEHLSGFDSERWFFEYYMRWKQYRLIQAHYLSHHKKIFNSTEGGMLDVFPRKSLREILEIK